MFDLEGREHQISTEKQIQNVKVCIGVESHASIAFITCFYFALGTLSFSIQLIVTNNWENPEDKCMYN
jgi:hypothetical protein